jgi:hypothetical protein
MAKRAGGKTTKQARAQRSTHPAGAGRGRGGARYTSPAGRVDGNRARRREAVSGGPKKGGQRP